MIGEMRDLETAEIAIRAALTGHLVLSTLHTNDAIGGVTRLIDMGLEPFLVASSVRAFLAQRLVRVLCPHCKQPGEYSRANLLEMGFPVDQEQHLMKAVGCDRCRRTGYAGRLALYEIVTITKKMEDLITQRKSASVLRQTALAEGMVPLRQYGFQKAIQGLTTLEEVLRVTTADLAALDE
jgi:general secretion pathway protein E/type IV pilus assembly protein PilB